MAEENTGVPVAMELDEDEDSQEENSDILSSDIPSFDIPVIAVAEISGQENSTEEYDVTAEVNEPEASIEVITESNTSKIRPKILSRYRLPSTGSCHDLCKYGMKHSSEGKPESPLLRKVKSCGGSGRDYKRTTSSLANQNNRSISLKSSPDSGTRFSVSNNDSKQEIISSPKIATVPPKRALAPIKEEEVSVVHRSGTKLISSKSKGSSFAGQVGSKTNKGFGKGEEKDRGSRSFTYSTSRSQENNISVEVPPVVSCSPRNHVKRVANSDKSNIGRCRLRNQSHSIKSKPVHSNNEDAEEKTLYIIESSTKNETEGSAQSNGHIADSSLPQSSSVTDNGLKHDQEVDQTSKVPPLSEKKNVKHARTGISSKTLLKPSSLSWGFKGLHKKFGIVSSQSSPSSSKSPSTLIHRKHGRPSSGNDGEKNEYSKVEQKSKPRKMGISESENRDGESRRVKFRKGRVVDLKPENNTPMRLKFRRVRLLGETQNSKSDLRKRSIQGKEANHSDDEANQTENRKKKCFRRNETVDSKSAANRIKSERVVLRHQDSKGKKKIQNLFNNVIEETATKLVETRKSRVKALVGAFETVISLQDARPAATIGA